jgi:hypothetical protein
MESTDPIPSCASTSHNPAGKSVWWVYTAGVSGQVTATTIGSAYDTVLDVFTGTPGSLVEVPSGCNNHASSTVTQSQVTFGTVSGTTYYLMVSVFDSTLCPPAGTLVSECGGKTVFNFSGPTPAGLAATPNAATISAGSSMNFTINTLAPPLSGQVSFSLAGCPPLATCTFTSSTVTAGTANTLMVTTTASTITTPAPGARKGPRSIEPWNPAILRGLWIFMMALLVMLGLPRGKRRRIALRVPLAILIALAAFGMLSCGGGTAESTVVIPGTTAGAYPLVITATGSGNTTATTTVNITVD